MATLAHRISPLALLVLTLSSPAAGSPREMSKLASDVLNDGELRQAESAGKKAWRDVRKAIAGVSTKKVRKAIGLKAEGVVIGQRVAGKQGTHVLSERLLVTRKGLMIQRIQLRESVGFTPSPVLEGVEMKPATLGFEVGRYRFKLSRKTTLIKREDWQSALNPAGVEGAVKAALTQK